MANVLFNSGKLNDALKLLREVNFNDLYYQLDSRVLLLKIYFEQEDHETLDYHLEAFKTFLMRNKLVSEYQRTIYKNLIRHTSRLSKGMDNEAKVLKVKTELEEKKQTAESNWLINKINGILN
jgi:hypothetical protein